MDKEWLDKEWLDKEWLDKEIHNEEYIPKEPNYYNYKAKNNFLLYFSDDITCFNKVHICAYKVNNNTSAPFLNILLHKQKGYNTLCMPEVPIFKQFESSELINYSKIYLFGLCLLDNYETFVETLEFNGFYIFDNNLYLFFDITKCELKINDIYNNSPLWFAIMDEIVNYKTICDIKIDDNVANLFTLNEELCFLSDENEEYYETPVICFVGSSKEKVSFKYVFGESSQNKNAILGPYYYFTNFNKACKDEDSDCIIRFAVFLGNVKYIENDQDDPIDDSEIKKQRLQDSSIDQNMERLTMRISDHDGNWAEIFNSAYLGRIELDNGEYLKNVPLLAVREYTQQIPLSYHYIDKKKSRKEVDEFFIM